jgi:hypothetical protein
MPLSESKQDGRMENRSKIKKNTGIEKQRGRK